MVASPPPRLPTFVGGTPLPSRDSKTLMCGTRFLPLRSFCDLPIESEPAVALTEIKLLKCAQQ